MPEDPNASVAIEADVSLTSSRVQGAVEDTVDQNTDCSSSGKSLAWEIVDADAPDGKYLMDVLRVMIVNN